MLRKQYQLEAIFCALGTLITSTEVSRLAKYFDPAPSTIFYQESFEGIVAIPNYRLTFPSMISCFEAIVYPITDSFDYKQVCELAYYPSYYPGSQEYRKQPQVCGHIEGSL